MTEPRLYDPDEWEHGLRCAECEREFVLDQPISEVLEGMTTFSDEPTFIVLIVCPECALGFTGRSVG